MPQDAFQQFADTEKWRKDNNLEALYEKIDITDYQEARSVVSGSDLTFVSLADTPSIPNGLVEGTNVVYRSICMKLASWIQKR